MSCVMKPGSFPVNLHEGDFDPCYENPNVFLSLSNTPDGDGNYSRVTNPKINIDYYMVVNVSNVFANASITITSLETGASNGMVIGDDGSGTVQADLTDGSIDPLSSKEFVSESTVKFTKTGHNCLKAYLKGWSSSDRNVPTPPDPYPSKPSTAYDLFAQYNLSIAQLTLAEPSTNFEFEANESTNEIKITPVEGASLDVHPTFHISLDGEHLESFVSADLASKTLKIEPQKKHTIKIDAPKNIQVGTSSRYRVTNLEGTEGFEVLIEYKK